MQAIQTKYLGPTNHRGSRVKATCAAGSVIVSWDYSLPNNIEENHRAAAYFLAVNKLKWDPWLKFANFETGQLADGSYVHVLRGEK